MKWILFITFIYPSSTGMETKHYLGGTFKSEAECRAVLERKLDEQQGIGWCRVENAPQRYIEVIFHDA